MSARVVFDTNVVLSALLFERGQVSWLRRAWALGWCVPVVSVATVAELVRALSYPKFRLTTAEREEVLGEYLPFAEAIEVTASPVHLPACRHEEDRKFLELAVVAAADALVSGDADLLALAGDSPIPILSPAQARRRFWRR